MLCCRSIRTKDSSSRYKTTDTKDRNEPTTSPKTDVTPGVKEGAEAENFLKCTIEEAEEFFSVLLTDKRKKVVEHTFLNSLLDFISKKWEMDGESAKRTIANSLPKRKGSHPEPLFDGIIKDMKENCVDDGFKRVFTVWEANNPSCSKKITIKELQSILNALSIHLDALELLTMLSNSIKRKDSKTSQRSVSPLTAMPQGRSREEESFTEILRRKSPYPVSATSLVTFFHVLGFHFRWISCNKVALEVFAENSHGKEAMNNQEFAEFLRKTQGTDATELYVQNALKFRYGGYIHRYNFACFNGSILTNPAIEPLRTTAVCQDMTQPFTRYIIGCARVNSSSNFLKAIERGGVRAFVLPSLTRVPSLQNDSKSVPSHSTPTTVPTSPFSKTNTLLFTSLSNKDDFQCGDCYLSTIISKIKDSGFVKNTYPIILCLPPIKDMPYEDQVLLGTLLEDGFKDMLGKGFMMEGGLLDDPKFSPSALRKKVLVMGDQGELKAYAGFMVADMHQKGIGVRVTEVKGGSPAARAGILPGLWITHVNGRHIPDKETLREILKTAQVGSELVIRQENIRDIKIILGGEVCDRRPDTPPGPVSSDHTNCTSSSNSKISGYLATELSKLIFFKYISGESVTENYKPWDTYIISTQELLSLDGETDENVEDSEFSKASAGALYSKRESKEWFSIVHIDGKNLSSSHINRLLSAATREGVQFVDIDNSEQCLAWFSGRFMDNGGCGYLLYSDVPNKSLSYRLPTKISIAVQVGPRAIGNPPLKKVVGELIGDGKMTLQKRRLYFENCTVSSVCSLRFVFYNPYEENTETDEENPTYVFTTSFCPALCRLGFRVLPCKPITKLSNVCEGNEIHGIYAYVT